ncbi:hypothetical protein, partial [Streptomyces sp. NPDC054849]
MLMALTVLGLAACLAVDGGGAGAAVLWVSAGAGVVLGAVMSVFDELAGLFFTSSPARSRMTGRVTRREFP